MVLTNRRNSNAFVGKRLIAEWLPQHYYAVFIRYFLAPQRTGLVAHS